MRNVLRKNVERDNEFDSHNYEEVDEDEVNVEMNPALPVISNEGFYWPGKDYLNSYISGLKNVADFSAGKWLCYEVRDTFSPKFSARS